MKTRKQVAALPFVCVGKSMRVLLITSRETKRWIIPKGWPKKGTADHKMALLEAYEEAGLRGRIGKLPIGQYSYIKILGDRSKVKCNVDVFPLLVDSQMLDWPEKGQRQLNWLRPKKAGERVLEKQLRKILQGFRPKPKHCKFT